MLVGVLELKELVTGVLSPDEKTVTKELLVKVVLVSVTLTGVLVENENVSSVLIVVECVLGPK